MKVFNALGKQRDILLNKFKPQSYYNNIEGAFPIFSEVIYLLLLANAI